MPLKSTQLTLPARNDLANLILRFETQAWINRQAEHSFSRFCRDWNA
jgi:hypothetical protein